MRSWHEKHWMTQQQTVQRRKKPKADETKFEDAKDDEFNFLWTQVEDP